MKRAEDHRLACGASFEIEGFGLRFEAASDDLLGPVRHLFQRFRSASASPDAWTVRMERVDWSRLPAASPGLRSIWAGDVAHGIRSVSSVGSGRRRSVMVLAESGTGKSTTALALTGAGWQLMGDDITVIRRTADGVRATGFPRECHVRTPTLRLLPWLNALKLEPAEVETLGPFLMESLRL